MMKNVNLQHEPISQLYKELYFYYVYLGIIYRLGLYSKLHTFSLKFLATLEEH